MGFSKNNLQPDSKQWGREVEAKLEELERSAKLARTDHNATAAIVKANYETTGVTQKALEETLTYLRGLSFRYATFESNAVWRRQPASITETLVGGTEFYLNLERRPKSASAFITVTCDVDLVCERAPAEALMSQIISQYVYIQSYQGTTTNPWGSPHTSTNIAEGRYSGPTSIGYMLAKSNTKSGIRTNDPDTYLLGGSNITTTAGAYLNPAYAYRVTTRLTRYTANPDGENAALYSGNISPQTMTIQITP